MSENGHVVPDLIVASRLVRGKPVVSKQGAAASQSAEVPAGVSQDSTIGLTPEPWWLAHGVGPYLVVGDTLAFLVATAITRPPSLYHLLMLAVYLIVFEVAGLYRSRLTLSLLDDLPYIIAAAFVGATIKISLSTLTAGLDPPARQMVHLLVLLAAIMLVRATAYAVVRAARRRGLVCHRTLVLGAEEIGMRLAASMLEHREYGLEPVGFVESEERAASDMLPAPVLGDYHQLGELIDKYAIRDVVVAYGEIPESNLVDILTTCDRLDVEIFWVPRLFELHNSRRDTDHLWGIPLVRAREAAFKSPWWPLKRAVDLFCAGVSLALLSPLLLVCALAVRWEGGPGVIFKQERIGLDGRPFQVLKFRSLRPVDNTESETNWNIKHDNRLGPVGKFLRSTSLDELPQLWNIVRGDMSLVGPRPERPHFVNQFSTHIPRYGARHRVPVGLTGWAQAHGLRGDTSIEDRARFDNYYIENWSPWLDAKILVKTINQVLRRQGG